MQPYIGYICIVKFNCLYISLGGEFPRIRRFGLSNTVNLVIYWILKVVVSRNILRLKVSSSQVEGYRCQRWCTGFSQFFLTGLQADTGQADIFKFSQYVLQIARKLFSLCWTGTQHTLQQRPDFRHLRRHPKFLHLFEQSDDPPTSGQLLTMLQIRGVNQSIG